MKELIIYSLLTGVLNISTFAQSTDWKAKRITASESQNEPNIWIDLRKDIELKTVTGKAIAKIASDSKYWLWINDTLAVSELKRGPIPNDTYYDEVDIAPFLKKGKN